MKLWKEELHTGTADKYLQIYLGDSDSYCLSTEIAVFRELYKVDNFS